MCIKTLFWWQGEKSKQRLTWNGLCKWSPCNAVMHENQIWTHALEIQIWKQMHVWWHRTFLSQLLKMLHWGKRRGMLVDSCKQMWTTCPSHSQGSWVLRKTAQPVNEAWELRLLQWKEICTNKHTHKAMIPFCWLHCTAAEVRALNWRVKGFTNTVSSFKSCSLPISII